MGKRFFTSDWHLNSALISKYAHRPIADAKTAAQALVDMCNRTAEAEDTVIHVGDFILLRHDRHGEADDDATGMPSQDEWLKQLKANIFLVEGNHDSGHNADAAAKCLLIDLSRNFRQVTVGHHPSYCKEYAGNYGGSHFPHLHLCGHVHDKWKVCYDHKAHVLNINVGVDVWGYKLVSDVALANLADFTFKHCTFRKDFRYTKLEWTNFVDAVSEATRLAAKQRKEEKHRKKGLTPEECQRRKEAAMRAKGLIK